MNAKSAWIVASCLFLLVSSSAVASTVPPEVSIGQRLFMEPRFAQAFFAGCKGNVNATVPGDPALDNLQTAGSPLPSPFKGQTMSCRTCHMEDDALSITGGGMRTYADFARRSPIPARADGKKTTTRNSPTLVGASLPRPGFFLHFDAEFATGPDLVIGGFTGRNFGWLANEQATAIKHIAKVIREDSGLGDLGKIYGGAYAKVLSGDPSVPVQFLIPTNLRVNVKTANDAAILAAVSKLVNAYMLSLDFKRDDSGAYSGSPYDLFLKRNNIPRKPDNGEPRESYSRRLRDAVMALKNPVFVTTNDGAFTTHPIPFVFGPDELAGLKLFMSDRPEGGIPPPPPVPGGPQNPPPPPTARHGAGNCLSCHTAPEFTDFRFHNTGVEQLEYDAIFGTGAFAALKIPTLAQRMASPVNALPASAAHPNYKGLFRSIPTAGKPGEVDLGLWNVYANPDIPKPQASLNALLGGTNPSQILDSTVALFKTPGLRDLGHSQPYLHNGRLDTLRDVVGFYAQAGQLQRDGKLRNGDPRMGGIFLTPEEVNQIAKFLDALNEDFAD